MSFWQPFSVGLFYWISVLILFLYVFSKGVFSSRFMPSIFGLLLYLIFILFRIIVGQNSLSVCLLVNTVYSDLEFEILKRHLLAYRLTLSTALYFLCCFVFIFMFDPEYNIICLDWYVGSWCRVNPDHAALCWKGLKALNPVVYHYWWCRLLIYIDLFLPWFTCFSERYAETARVCLVCRSMHTAVSRQLVRLYRRQFQN